jgi:hypothetical protein
MLWVFSFLQGKTSGLISPETPGFGCPCLFGCWGLLGALAGAPGLAC